MKKLIAIAMIVTVIFSNLSYVFAEENITYKKLIVDVDNVDEMYTLLETLNIINAPLTSSAYNNTLLTRKEIAGLVARTLDFEKFGGIESKSLDVAQDDPYYAAVNFMIERKLMSMDKDGNFYPDRYVMYQDMNKILISALGYDIYAKQKGGYPLGYNIVANDLKLNKMVVGESDSYITRGAAVNLIYNMIDIPMLNTKSFSEQIEYYADKNDTILFTVFETRKVIGIVNATELTGLRDGNKTIKNSIKIGNEIYRTKKNYFDLVGREIKAYLRLINEENMEYIIFAKLTEKDSVLNIKSYDVDFEKTTKSKILYSEDENITSEYANIANDASIIYNGKYLKQINDATNDELKMMSDNGVDHCFGELNLIDIDDDDVYDIVIKNVFTSMLVENADQVEAVFSNATFNRRWELDCSSNSYNCIIYKDGELVDQKSIKVGDVINVAVNEDETVKIVYVTTEAVKGIIQEIEDDKVLIDGELYPINIDYKIAASEMKVKTLDLNMEGTFYLDLYGHIAAATLIDDGLEKYGYVVGFNVSDKGVDDIAQFKLFTLNGKMEIFNCSDKVKLDADSYYATQLQGNSKLYKDGKLINQIIKYSLNQDKNISKIRIAIDDTLNPNGYSNEDFVLNCDSAKKIQILNPLLFGTSYALYDSVPVMVIPDPASATQSEIEDESKYMIGIGKNVFATNSSTSKPYTLKIYDADAYKIPKLVVSKQAIDSAYITSAGTLGIVTNITDAVNSQGEITKKITLGSADDGTTLAAIVNIKTIKVYEWNKTEKIDVEISLESIGKGDVVLFTKNIAGEISGIKRKFDYRGNNSVLYSDDPVADGDSSVGSTGFVNFIGIKDLSAQFTWGEDINPVYSIYSTKLFRFNVRTGKIDISKMSEIKTVRNVGIEQASRVFYYASYCRILNMVIYDE